MPFGGNLPVKKTLEKVNKTSRERIYLALQELFKYSGVKMGHC